MGWETFVNRHSQRRLEGIEDFPLTATLNLQRCLWTFHSALPSMGAFGAAVIVKTDLPSLHHLRPLTTEPFVYSHAGGFIISVTTRRIGRRKETNYLSRDECLRWEKGKGRERERGKGCHAGFHPDDFHEMIISWWNLLFFFVTALVIGTRSRVQRSLNFSGKQFSLRRVSMRNEVEREEVIKVRLESVGR